MNEQDGRCLMERHAEAWNAHDVNALLSLMTEDCIYDASAGEFSHGTRSIGHAELRPVFETIWATFKDARWDEAEHFVFGDRGFSTWTFRGTKPDGKKVEVMGLDVLRFRDGKICHKNTYRKHLLS